MTELTLCRPYSNIISINLRVKVNFFTHRTAADVLTGSPRIFYMKRRWNTPIM